MSRRNRVEPRLGVGDARGAPRLSRRNGTGSSRSSSAQRTPVSAAHCNGFFCGHVVGPERVVVEHERRHDRRARAVAGPHGVRIFGREHVVAAAQPDQTLVVRDAAPLRRE